ncbi:MAG: type II secretion system protein [Cellulosilyticaceae bacterium]
MGLKKKVASGMTLIEVLVVVAIVSILIVPVLDLMQVESRIARQTSQTIAAKDIGTIIQNHIAKELKYAKKVKIGTASESGMGFITQPIKGHDMVCSESIGGVTKTNVILQKGLITPFEVAISYKTTTKANVVNVKIIVSNNEKSYVFETAVKLLNATVEGMSEGNFINFEKLEGGE